MLPNVDGFTIASEIRKINNNVPIIFLTAMKLKEDVLRGYGVGGDDYVTKPFDTDILLAKIRAIISRRESQSDIRDIFRNRQICFRPTADTHNR